MLPGGWGSGFAVVASGRHFNQSTWYRLRFYVISGFLGREASTLSTLHRLDFHLLNHRLCLSRKRKAMARSETLIAPNTVLFTENWIGMSSAILSPSSTAFFFCFLSSYLRLKHLDFSSKNFRTFILLQLALLLWLILIIQLCQVVI